MSKVTIVNLCDYKEQNREFLWKVDRSGPLGNPFIMYTEDDRDCVCDRYEEWFIALLEGERYTDQMARDTLETMKKVLLEGDPIVLGCWCHPLRCHAETIKRWLENEVRSAEENNT